MGSPRANPSRSAFGRAAAGLAILVVLVAGGYAGRRLWLKSDDLLRPVLVARGDDAAALVRPTLGARVRAVLGGAPATGPAAPGGPAAPARLVALTFDDGPYPVTTPLLVQTLRELGVPATFFLIGRDAEQFPALVRAIAAGGNEIADHTLTHPDLDRLDDAARCGPSWRPAPPRWSGSSPTRPCGACSGRRTAATRWPRSARRRRPASTPCCGTTTRATGVRSARAALEAHLLRHATAPEVVLLHSGRVATIALLPDLVARYRRAGYTFVTVGALLRRVPGGRHSRLPLAAKLTARGRPHPSRASNSAARDAVEWSRAARAAPFSSSAAAREEPTRVANGLYPVWPFSKPCSTATSAKSTGCAKPPSASTRSSRRSRPSPTTSSATRPPSSARRLERGETLDALLPEAFAVVRETGKRVSGMRHFDVQIMGGQALHEGNVAEMRTGEGKTLVATLPVYLNALTGKGVHLVTVNDYLAKRDAEWMGPIYQALGHDHRRDPARPRQRRPQGRVRLRHHLRHQQRGRLRLPARQHGLGARPDGPAPPRLRDRRRGRLDPDRRGAHAADHQRPGPRRDRAVRAVRQSDPAPGQGRGLHGRREGARGSDHGSGRRQGREDAGRHRTSTTSATSS